MKLREEWQLQEVRKHDEGIIHDPMERENFFYYAVQSGNLEYVRENCERGDFANQAGKGILSTNPLTNLKYHFVVTTAMITRNCVAAGMVQEKAYRMSDFYIRKMDACNTLEQVCEMHKEMVIDFTQKMRDYQVSKCISKIVAKSIDYIYEHIQNRITLEELAESVQISASYLSRQFKKEMGVSVSDYIRERKIERAKNLLRYSDFSYIDIAHYLAFSSQSHFIQIFEKYEGITPKKYREQFYRTSWGSV